MKTKRVKQILLWSLVAVAVLVAVYCVLRFGFAIDVLDRTGWNTKDGTVRYLDYFGRPQTGWQEIEGKHYYFDPEAGAMVTGWQTVDGASYFFRANGERATGWLEKDGKRYYLGDDGILTTGWVHRSENSYYFSLEDGAMVTGWLRLEDKTYYLSPENGVMRKGWIELDGKRYYCSPEDGTILSGWLELEGKHYYLGADGAASMGWVEVEGVRHRFAEDGSAVTGWYEDDTGRYYFDEDGHPQSGWLDWERKRYYLRDDGSVTTGWLTLEEDRYYFLPTGRMAIGEVEVDGISRFFTSTGKEVLLCNPWHPVPDDFETNLVDIDGFKIDADARDPLAQLLSDARADGVKITINNTYRSRATQQSMWDRRVAQRMAEGMTKAQAEAKTGESVAIPGHSEHQTGLALDVNSGTKVYSWLGEHCWDYGFIIRYPADRMEITGIIYEPWHLRYVGTELALELEELGLCMEEYMSMLTGQQQQIPD